MNYDHVRRVTPLSLLFVLLLAACGHRPQPERPVFLAKCDTLPGVCRGLIAFAIPDPWEPQERVRMLRKQLADRRSQWDMAGIGDYAFTLQRWGATVVPFAGHGSLFVRVTVRGGEIVSWTNTQTGEQLDPSLRALFFPAEGFFQALEDGLDGEVDVILVEFDERLGYPTWLWVGPIEDGFDDGDGYLVSDFVVQEPAAMPAHSDVARLIVDELGHLKSGLSLAAWRATNPAEAITRYLPTDGPFGGALPHDEQTWCARATRRAELQGGAILRRYADFYPPMPPPSLVLPSPPNGADLVDRDCTLGRITVEVGEPYYERGERLTRSVTQLLDARYGPGLRDAQLHGIGSIHWTERAAWRRDSTEIVIAYVPDGSKSRMLAIAYLPIACESALNGRVRDPCPDEIDYYFKRDGDVRHAAGTMVNIAAIDIDLAERLLGWLREDQEVEDKLRRFEGISFDATEIVSGLEAWLASADTLDPHRRAAALLVADWVLEGPGRIAGLLANGPHDAERAQLQALGATLTDIPDSQDISYASDWLVQAWRLDRNGPVGDQALLVLLERGASVLGCDEPLAEGERFGEEAFQCVIPAGEEGLEQRMDSRTRAKIHRLLGDAYRDIVALAYGAEHGYADSAAYRPEARTARLKAIEHYRQGLDEADLTPITWLQWREAWRLIAGLVPLYTRFYYLPRL